MYLFVSNQYNKKLPFNIKIENLPNINTINSFWIEMKTSQTRHDVTTAELTSWGQWRHCVNNSQEVVGEILQLFLSKINIP